MTGNLVSIVLPTLNGMATLPAVMAALDAQDFAGGVERVAVDSGSTDGTAAWLRDRVDRLIEIPAMQFNHGLTRNLAIGAARGSLVVLLVQDAVPASRTWLSALVAPFAVRPELAGVSARQRPRPDAGALSRRYLASWVMTSDTPWVHRLDGHAEFESLSPLDRLRRCAFDNVCSCLRRDVWEAHPFRETPIAEDLEWAREVLLAGHAIGYAPDAEVIHSHDRSVRYEFSRTAVLHHRLHALFGLRTIPTVRHLARAVGATSAAHVRWLREPGGDTVRAPVRAAAVGRALGLGVAMPLAQYLGGLSGARGWPPPRLGHV